MKYNVAMNPSQTDFLSRYQPWRRLVEPGFWMVLYFLQACIGSWTAWSDLARNHLVYSFWQPLVWESSSNLVLLALVPLVVALEQRLPLRLATLRRNLPRHLAATLLFCLLHVGAMVALRKLAYLAMGGDYDFGAWWRELPYEYLKDVRSYFGIIILVGFYRLLMLRWQGEASLLGEPDQGPAVEAVAQPERFLVRKLGKDFLLPAAEIEYAQAWGNYVNLHVRQHDYPLRSTMAAIEKRLDPARFVRVHRSYIVNLDFVAAIEALESGDARARLHSGGEVPVSRRYREALKKLSAA